MIRIVARQLRPPYLGIGLFALSLALLTVAAPNLVAIACLLGGGAALALFGFTRSRFALIVMTLMMLSISGCGLLAALILHSFPLLPVAALQIVAIFLLESREARLWMDNASPALARYRRHA